jgi:hypothetical protein
MAGVRKKKVSPKVKKVSRVAKKTVAKKTIKKKSSVKISDEQLKSMIRERAYYIWEERGKPCGQDCEIWTQAEQDICGMLKNR